jgi:hypothetical protein
MKTTKTGNGTKDGVTRMIKTLISHSNLPNLQTMPVTVSSQWIDIGPTSWCLDLQYKEHDGIRFYQTYLDTMKKERALKTFIALVATQAFGHCLLATSSTQSPIIIIWGPAEELLAETTKHYRVDGLKSLPSLALEIDNDATSRSNHDDPSHYCLKEL